MEHLTKQQIVLLTLLVSFVTSLSTGIVTVSLMDQSPQVTHTISQVIEKTIQQASPQNAAVGVISINVDDEIASSTALVSSSLVKIAIKNNLNNPQINSVTSSIDQTNYSVIGLGIIISKDGSVITDKSLINPNQNYFAILPDGSVSSLTVISPNSALTNALPTNFQLLKISNTNLANNFSNFASITNSIKLGQKIFSLTGTTTLNFEDGVITQIGAGSVSTSINNTSSTTAGSPLFDITGSVIGLWISSSSPAYYVFPNDIAPNNAP